VPEERFEIGAHVLASDGECGELVRVVVDPVKQALTHLVVAPKHHHGLDKLVALEAVEAVEGDHLRLRYTKAEFAELDDAEDVQFLPTDTDVLGYGKPHAVVWPFYPLGSLGLTPGQRHHSPMLSDRIPLDEVEVQRGDQVHATDGHVGSVHGLVIDPGDHHVTHVLLEEGHIWGHKQVAIPIGATARVGLEVQVDLTKQQIEDLPPVELG
jgi:sporulation protein YlmC with PRC-barrel domain